MFGLGFTEIIVIAVIILVVIKPEDLPSFVKKAGNTAGEVKKTVKEVNKLKEDFVAIADVDVKKAAENKAKKIVADTVKITD